MGHVACDPIFADSAQGGNPIKIVISPTGDKTLSH